MNNNLKIILLFAIYAVSLSRTTYAGGPLDPVRVGSWTINAGVGVGAHYFGNGSGFGPALKGSFETGMWDLGPGVITLGGEATFSFFSHNYGVDNWNESWCNYYTQYWQKGV